MSSAPPHIEEGGIKIISKKKIKIGGEDSMENAITVARQATAKPTVGLHQRKVIAEHQRDHSQRQMEGEAYRLEAMTRRTIRLKHLGWHLPIWQILQDATS